jgi:hypothetical protein
LNGEELSIFRQDDNLWHPLVVRYSDMIADDWIICPRPIPVNPIPLTAA